MILYKMIVDAGLLLQLDDVRNATAVGDLKDLRRWLSQQTDIVNHAIEDLLATASAITCAGAHGWQAWKIVELAPGQTLIPAVISHDTNVVEHPGVVAARGSPRSSGARTSSPTPIAAMRKGRLSAPPPVDHMGEAADIGRRGALASKRLWP